ncbi:MAG: pyruvate, phosphate dikinase, partial [Leptospiraceae bacterium]|nr:pyruvate, phosphate dikinase [Leptospiraceae bacterium]
MANKYIYFFGDGKADGNAADKALLGGKGANLAEMVSLGIPVPPGFTISTDICTYYYQNNRTYPAELNAEINANIELLEKSTGKKFGDNSNPLLVSVRSGSAVSMPGMMDTVLNLGLNNKSVEGLIQSSNNERFAWDAYRRFIQMFGNVVLQIKGEEFEHILDDVKLKKNAVHDTELEAADLKNLVPLYLEKVKELTGEEFPQDPRDQLQKSIDAVFASWMNPRAITYRKMNDISDKLGTAVNVQSMVFGNLGSTSGTGVAFTRNPSNGEKKFFGEFLMNAQGEDVVAGIRTPLSIEKLEAILPKAYNDLLSVAEKLEKHYKDMQDIEFTIENEKLYMLQTRNGKRTSFAAFRVAVEMVEEKLIDERTALLRIDPSALPSLLAKIFDEQEKKAAIDKNLLIAKGLNAGPGAASGRIALSAEKAQQYATAGEHCILVRIETSPEDISGMYSAEGVLTARGGMTSHAAVVARGMNKPCVVGCSALEINYKTASIEIKQKNGNTVLLKEGDHISIDGFTGEVLHAAIQTIPSEIEQVFVAGTLKKEDSLLARQYDELMNWADTHARLKVRANADTGEDARVARSYGARGIGLCRTEHMFFQEDRIAAMREMILAENTTAREAALSKLLPFQRSDFKSLLKEMSSLPVTIRLLDPPLHEFLPQDEETIRNLAKQTGRTEREVRQKIEEIHEFNPMLGHRGCRLGVTYPEITKMQVRAILEATAELQKEGNTVLPEIMVPLVGHWKELADQRAIVEAVAAEIEKEKGHPVKYLLGTMIEVPRAAITAHEIAKYAEFFSFGTNDLTQMGSGFSRDDSEHFLTTYLDKEIYAKNPFQVLDRDGIGEFIKIACEKGLQTNAKLKLGVCGEHGGD